MNSVTTPPLVSVLTPVHNGAKNLSKCIESVLAQTYTHWEYTIVDNCSTDDSLAIAQKYAAGDPRIRVLKNGSWLGAVESRNQTIKELSPQSKYCKFVFAEDWLYPTCIAEMVQVAESTPSVGLVGAYTTDGRSILWNGPQYPGPTVSGREVCRSMLLGGPYVLGSMTSLLIRSDLIRKRPQFFDRKNPYSENAASYDVLRESDYGYIHEILSFHNPREHADDRVPADFNTHNLGRLVIFLKYGPIFLDQTEYQLHLKKQRLEYHRMLANNVLRVRPRRYWHYHRDTLAAFGSHIDKGLLASSVIWEIARQLSRPVEGVGKGFRWFGAMRRANPRIL